MALCRKISITLNNEGTFTYALQAFVVFKIYAVFVYNVYMYLYVFIAELDDNG